MAVEKLITKLRGDVENVEEWNVAVKVIPPQRVKINVKYGGKVIREGFTSRRTGWFNSTVYQNEFGEEPEFRKLRAEVVEAKKVSTEARQAPQPDVVPEGAFDDREPEAPAVEERQAAPAAAEPQAAPAIEAPPDAPAQPSPVRGREEPRGRSERRERPQRQTPAPRQPQHLEKPQWKDLNLEILSATSQGLQGTMVVAQVTGLNGDRTRKGVKGATVVFSDTGVKKETKKTNAAGLVEYLAPRVGVREVHVALAGSSPVSEDHTYVY